MFYEIGNVISQIQVLLTPVIMISACGLLMLGMKNRYSRINDRLRGLTRERLGLLPKREEEQPRFQLAAIDAQLPQLLDRNRLLRNAVLALYLGIICFLCAVLVIAFSLFKSSAFSAYLTMAVFLLGVGFVLASMILMAREIYISDHAVTYETLQTMKL